MPTSCLRLTLLAISILVCPACEAEAPLQDPVALTSILSHLLGDPDPSVRQTAALSLGKIAHGSGLPALVIALKDSDPLVREYSAWAIGEIGEAVNDNATIALVSALVDKVPAVKHAAAQALGKVEPKESIIDVLAEALSVGTVSSRQATVEALMQLESHRAYPALVGVLQDPDPLVRQGAVAALGELGDTHALPELRKRLLYDSDVGVRTEAAYRIGKLGGKQDLATLQKAAERDPTAFIHLWAMWAIKNITDEPATEKTLVQ